MNLTRRSLFGAIGAALAAPLMKLIAKPPDGTLTLVAGSGVRIYTTDGGDSIIHSDGPHQIYATRPRLVEVNRDDRGAIIGWVDYPAEEA